MRFVEKQWGNSTQIDGYQIDGHQIYNVHFISSIVDQR